MQEVIFNDQGLVARKWVKLGGRVLYLETHPVFLKYRIYSCTSRIFWT